MIATSFYAVTSELIDENGDKRKVWDAVDDKESQLVGYFYQALRDNEEVELIFTPKAPRHCVLVMKIAYQSTE
jgi:hypothetical protein